MDSAEPCFWLAYLLNEVLYPNPFDETLAKAECRTDNHQLYDALYSIRPIPDKRLRIEIEILREMLNRNEYNIDWTDKTNQIAEEIWFSVGEITQFI